MNKTLLMELLIQIRPEFEDIITEDTRLEDMGLSSLDKMILICEIEKNIGTQIQLEKVKRLTTVGDILTLLHNGGV